MIRSIRIRKSVGEILSFLFVCFFDFPKDTQGRGKTRGVIQGGRRAYDAEGKRCGDALGFEGKKWQKNTE
jgi:hypothetical protein